MLVRMLSLVLAGVLMGCSGDDMQPPAGSVSQVPDFIALGEDLGNVYLYSYEKEAGAGTTANLTDENMVDNRFLTLRQNGEVLTFFTFSSGSFSAIQRNVYNGDARLLSNVYVVSDDRSVIWGTNSEEKLFFGYYSPRGSNNFGMRTLDIDSGDFIDIPLEANVQNVYEPLYFNGKLFATYRAFGGEYRTAIIEETTSTVLRTWDFGTRVPSFFVEEAGDIGVITSTEGNSYVQAIYDFDSLEKLSEASFSVNRFFPPGPLQAELIADRLYYLNFYAQPSQVPYGPAVYDFRGKENSIVDMVGIIQDLERELGAEIGLTSYRYNPAGRSFLLGYTRDYSNGLFQGGIMVISEEGALIENLQTPFIPIYFLESRDF